MSWILLAGGTVLRLGLGWAAWGGVAGPLPAVAAVTLAGVALVLAARQLHDAESAARVAWLWLLLPLFTDAAAFDTAAAPLLAAAAWTTWAVVRAVEAPTLAHWLLVGAAAGLTLALDLVALPLLLGVALAALRVHELRRLARTPGPWLALALAVALGAALLRVLGAPPAEATPGSRAFTLARDLILLVTPLVALLVVGAQVVALRAGSRPSRGALAGMGLAGLAGAVALALWRAPAGGASAVTVLPGLVVLATGAMAERSRWWRPALALALVGSVLLVALRAQEP